MRPHRSISQLALSSAWYDDCGLAMSRASSGVAPSSVVRARPAAAAVADLRETVAERVCVSTPAACSTLAAATLMLRLCASASAIELVEHGVAELLPPLGVGGVGGVLRLEAEGAGRIDRRPRVIGAERAAGGERSTRDGADDEHAARAAPRRMSVALGHAGGGAGGASARVARRRVRAAASSFPSPALGQRVEQIEEQRHVQHRERRLADHAADDAGADRVARVGACAERRARAAGSRTRRRARS